MEYEYTYDVTSDKAAGPLVTPGRAQGGDRQQHAPVNGDLLQVEQHGAGVGPEPPGALLGQGVAGGAPGHCTCSLHLAGSAPHLHAVPGPNMCARPNL